MRKISHPNHFSDICASLNTELPPSTDTDQWDNVDPYDSHTDFGDGNNLDDDNKSMNSDMIQLEPQEKEPYESCRELKCKVVKLEQEIVALQRVSRNGEQ